MIIETSLLLALLVPIILFAVAVNYVKDQQNTDSGRGYMAGLIISFLLYIPAVIAAAVTGGRNSTIVGIVVITYVMVMALSGAAINKYR